MASSGSSAVGYEIRFRSNWNAENLPSLEVEEDAQFGKQLIVLHSADYSVFDVGQNATAGLKNLAEDGNSEKLWEELIQDMIFGLVADVRETSEPIPAGFPETSFGVITGIDAPFLTILGKISPSSDWFVGVSSIPLQDVDGDWLEELSVDAYVWDAGTLFNGTETKEMIQKYSSVETAPREFWSLDGNTVPPIGTFTMLLAETSPPTQSPAPSLSGLPSVVPSLLLRGSTDDLIPPPVAPTVAIPIPSDIAKAPPLNSTSDKTTAIPTVDATIVVPPTSGGVRTSSNTIADTMIMMVFTLIVTAVMI